MQYAPLISLLYLGFVKCKNQRQRGLGRCRGGGVLGASQTFAIAPPSKRMGIPRSIMCCRGGSIGAGKGRGVLPF